MSVIVLVQGTPHPERKEALAEYQQTARTIIAKHGGQAVARGSGLGESSWLKQVPGWHRDSVRRPGCGRGLVQ